MKNVPQFIGFFLVRREKTVQTKKISVILKLNALVLPPSNGRQTDTCLVIYNIEHRICKKLLKSSQLEHEMLVLKIALSIKVVINFNLNNFQLKGGGGY